MRPRFQADADFNRKIVWGLRRREPLIDIVDASALARIPDGEVLRMAAASGRVLLTHDRKTMPRHLVRFLQQQSSPGVIVVPQSLDVGAAIEELLLVWAATDAQEWRDHLGFVPV